MAGSCELIFPSHKSSGPLWQRPKYADSSPPLCGRRSPRGASPKAGPGQRRGRGASGPAGRWAAKCRPPARCRA